VHLKSFEGEVVGRNSNKLTDEQKHLCACILMSFGFTTGRLVTTASRSPYKNLTNNGGVLINVRTEKFTPPTTPEFMKNRQLKRIQTEEEQTKLKSKPARNKSSPINNIKKGIEKKKYLKQNKVSQTVTHTINNITFDNIEEYLDINKKFNDQIIDSYFFVLAKRHTNCYFASSYFNLTTLRGKALLSQV
jgi:hypothetical protein